MSGLETMILAKGVSDLIDHLKKKFAQDEEIKEQIYKLVISHKTDDQTRVRLGRMTSTNTSRPQTASKEWDNPLDRDVKIKTISVVPSANFRTKGMLVISVNGVDIFANDAVADFTDIGDLEIPLRPQDTTIKRGKKIQFFIWNGTDSTEIALTATVTFGSGDGQ